MSDSTAPSSSEDKKLSNNQKTPSPALELAKYLGLAQVPLIAGFIIFWDHALSNKIIAGLVIAVYEFIASCTKEVWKEVWAKVWPLLKEILVNGIADPIVAALKGCSGFHKRYNRKIISDFGLFNVRGLGLINTFTLKLEQVFVELRIAPSQNPTKLPFDPIAAKELAGNRPIWEVLRVFKHDKENPVALAIVGTPGSGKTTLMQHVAVTLAGNRQRRYRSRAYVPLLLLLRDHIAVLTGENPPSLAALAQKQFEALNPAVGWLEKYLRRGKCLVLLDGLDEVGEAEKRRAVSRWVDEQIKKYPRSRFVLTARPQGYKDAPLNNAHVLEVLPFNNRQVRRFVEGWYLANEIASSGNKRNREVEERAGKDAADLLSRLRSKPALSDLTVNPLLLTMIAMVHRYHGALPGSRIELYAEICTVLLGRWRQTKGVEDKLSAEQKLVVLRPLAAHMMEKRTREISTADALKIVTPHLRRVGVAKEDAEKTLTDFQAGSGLILEREPGKWSFAHLTFQEYLTATVWLGQKEITHDWSALVGDSWWHETLRLYAAQSNATPIIKACLAVDNVPTLTLAMECMEEAREIDEVVRRDAECYLRDALESNNPEHFRLAAEVHLNRRLNNLQPFNNGSAIDLQFLTCAEYQLFLNEMQIQGEYYQPSHWTKLRFATGSALHPVKGIRVEDAQIFCDWLTAKQGHNGVFRLPTPQEVIDYANPYSQMATWCCENSRYGLYGLSQSAELTYRQKLLDSSHSIVPFPQSFSFERLYSRMFMAMDQTPVDQMPAIQMPVFPEHLMPTKTLSARSDESELIFTQHIQHTEMEDILLEATRRRRRRTQHRPFRLSMSQILIASLIFTQLLTVLWFQAGSLSLRQHELRLRMRISATKKEMVKVNSQISTLQGESKSYSSPTVQVSNKQEPTINKFEKTAISYESTKLSQLSVWLISLISILSLILWSRAFVNSLISDRAKKSSKVIDDVIKKIERGDFIAAKFAVNKLKNDSCVIVAQIAILFAHILKKYIASEDKELLSLNTLSYFTEALSILSPEDFRDSYIPFWVRPRWLRQQFMGQSDQQLLLEVYWWLHIMTEREKGKLEAWEGIRIVREIVPDDEK